jgi:hypothetical protein
LLGDKSLSTGLATPLYLEVQTQGHNGSQGKQRNYAAK